VREFVSGPFKLDALGERCGGSAVSEDRECVWSAWLVALVTLSAFSHHKLVRGTGAANAATSGRSLKESLGLAFNPQVLYQSAQQPGLAPCYPRRASDTTCVAAEALSQLQPQPQPQPQQEPQQPELLQPYISAGLIMCLRQLMA
jgi:hypothetical protein